MITSLPADADPAETFKCPRCHKHTVKWRFPSKEREPKSKMEAPTSPIVAPLSEFAQTAFSEMKEAVESQNKPI